MNQKIPASKKLLSNKKAFTLIEMVIALTIISLMVTGVIMGAGMIQSSRLSVARSLTERSPVPNIDGLIAWYETTSLDSLKNSEASDGVTVGTWYDINPSSIPSRNNTLIAKPGTEAITYVRDGINKIPALRFSVSGSASNFQLSAFNQGSVAQATAFIVMKQEPATASQPTVSWFLDSHSTGSSAALGYGIGASGNVRISASADGISGTTSNIPSFYDDKPNIVSIYYDGSYSKGYVNNATTRAGGANITPNPNADNHELSGLTIGSLKDSTNGERFVGLISEIIIYNRVLGMQERKDIFEYLSKKYNISVAGN